MALTLLLKGFALFGVEGKGNNKNGPARDCGNERHQLDIGIGIGIGKASMSVSRARPCCIHHSPLAL